MSAWAKIGKPQLEVEGIIVVVYITIVVVYKKLDGIRTAFLSHCVDATYQKKERSSR